MASLYRRKDSPFWWLKRKDGTGKPVCDSTGLRVESELESKQARVIAAEAEVAEAEFAMRGPVESGWGWVEGWLANHCKSPKTLRAYKTHWAHIRHFLQVHGLHHPRMLAFRHGAEYVEWRGGRRAQHKACSRNTALLEVKLLGQILKHAARRGMIPANPISGLGIAKEDVEPKREITEAEIKQCLDALPEEPEWMRLAFQIALHTGCRLRETALVMANVDFEAKTITFDTPKGGRSKAFTRPLPEALVGVLWPIRARKISHEFPFQPSRRFQQFFEKLKIEGVSFHCLRVSYVTRLHRAGVPLSAAMRLVNHSSEVVHRVYQRLRVDDVRQWADVPIFSTKKENPPAGEAGRRAEMSATATT